jgi:hypothetical protein
MAVTKERTFETALEANGKAEDGYEKPNKAQNANTSNIAASEYKVYRDRLVRGESVSIMKLMISTRNKGRKKSNMNTTLGVGG